MTTAEVQSHNIIAGGLGEFGLQWPVVSEEDPSSLVGRIDYAVYWMIEPLDGTKEFLDKSRNFTINIALIDNQRVVWGVVYAPALDLLYWGGQEAGSYRQNGGFDCKCRILQ